MIRPRGVIRSTHQVGDSLPIQRPLTAPEEVAHCIGYCEFCGDRCNVRAIDGRLVGDCQSHRCAQIRTVRP